MSEEKLLKGRNERDRPIEFRFPIKETSSSRGIIPGKEVHPTEAGWTLYTFPNYQ